MKPQILNAKIFTFLFIFICTFVSCDTYDESQKNFSKYRAIAWYVSLLQDMENWGLALKKYHDNHGEYPETSSISDLRQALAPFHNSKFGLRIDDPWEEKFVVVSKKNGYILSSKGSDKIGGHEFGGAIDSISYEDSTTLQNGIFKQYLKFKENFVREIENNIIKINLHQN